MSAEPAPGRLSDGDLDRIARRKQRQDSEPAPTPEDVVADALEPHDGVVADNGGDGWRIEDHGSAEWALAKVRQTHARHYDEVAPTLTAIDALEAEAQRLRDWVADRERQRDGRVAFFETHLTDYLRRIQEQEAADGVPESKRTKSLALSGGKVKSRAGSERIDVTDVGALAEWCTRESQSALVRRRVEPDRTELKRYLKETGEVPPGVSVETGERTYTVEVSS